MSVPPSSTRGLPAAAKGFLTLVAGVAVLFGLTLGGDLLRDGVPWGALALFAGTAAVAQLFVVVTPRNQSYHASIVFVFAAALVLPPELLPLVALVQHLPEWVQKRYPWYIQSFNIANYAVDLLVAGWVARVVSGLPADPRVGVAVGGLAAAAAFVLLNHGLLATMLRLARGHSFRTSGLFSGESLLTDLVLAAIGVVLAQLWGANPWLLWAAVAPLVLIQRSLVVPALEEQVRLDPKTGIANARHFMDALREELGQSTRYRRPFSLLMADLDLLRDVNNVYGHLAGDVVLRGVAGVLRDEARSYDLPARFGGEEFAMLLPDTTHAEALAIAERVRAAVEALQHDVPTSAVPLRATLSIGVATFPDDAEDTDALIHEADVAVYRAKRGGRNRVVSAAASEDAVPAALEAAPVETPVPGATVETVPPPPPPRLQPAAGETIVAVDRLRSLPRRLRLLVTGVALGGLAAGALGLTVHGSGDLAALVLLGLIVAAGQALALEVEGGSISVSAVAALAAAAVVGPRAALPLALLAAAADWCASRSAPYQLLYNVGSLTLGSLAASGAFAAVTAIDGRNSLLVAGAGVAAGSAYFAVNTGLVSLAVALETGQGPRATWWERFAWLAPHYVAFGALAAAMALAYWAIGLPGIAVLAAPLLLMRQTMAASVEHTERHARNLRQAAETIQQQNASLEQANRLLRERSTRAMETLSATVDARDAYTAGHSRRVQELSLAIGLQLGLSARELEVLEHSALFHDIGKLAVPDRVLLKPDRLSEDEWALMRSHAEEGAQIIDRLGFLDAAIPAIRHHHEHFDGSGYPAGLSGNQIPLGARIIHVADAFDSMVTTRVYRAALGVGEALVEIRRGTGSQFCPRCVAALDDLFSESASRRAA